MSSCEIVDTANRVAEFDFKVATGSFQAFEGFTAGIFAIETSSLGAAALGIAAKPYLVSAALSSVAVSGFAASLGLINKGIAAVAQSQCQQERLAQSVPLDSLLREFSFGQGCFSLEFRGPSIPFSEAGGSAEMELVHYSIPQLCSVW
jgi:hypothetical protein